MKKYSLLSKSMALLLTLGLSVSLFTGCQNKTAGSNANQTPRANANGTNKRTSNFNAQRPNADELKARMEENIKSLVTDGTITQSQADKIVEALTQNPGGFGGQRRSGGNQQTDGQNGQQNGQGNSSQNGNQNDNQNGNQNWQRNNNDGQNGQRNSALSKLVTDGVITQAQADAVMEKIKGNFTRPQQAPQNSQSKQSS